MFAIRRRYSYDTKPSMVLYRKCIGNVSAMYRQCIGNVSAMYRQLYRKCIDVVSNMYRQCIGNVSAMYRQCIVITIQITIHCRYAFDTVAYFSDFQPAISLRIECHTLQAYRAVSYAVSKLCIVPCRECCIACVSYFCIRSCISHRILLCVVPYRGNVSGTVS